MMMRTSGIEGEHHITDSSGHMSLSEDFVSTPRKRCALRLGADPPQQEHIWQNEDGRQDKDRHPGAGVGNGAEDLREHGQAESPADVEKCLHSALESIGSCLLHSEVTRSTDSKQ